MDLAAAGGREEGRRVSSSAIVDRLGGVFRQVFEDPRLVISRATTTKEIKGWDSFRYLNLIVAVEEEFGVTFTTWELGAFSSVGEIAEILAKKGVSDAP